MKKILKHFIDLKLKNEGQQKSQELLNFEASHEYLIKSFDIKINSIENLGNEFNFNPNNLIVLKNHKKNNAVELNVKMFKYGFEEDKEEYATSNILLSFIKKSEVFSKIKKDDLTVEHIFITDKQIACIFRNQNKLDYILEDNIIEIACITSINLSLEEFKKITRVN